MSKEEPAFIVLAVRQPYPLPYPKGTGAAAQFLTCGSNDLQIILPGMLHEEKEAIRKGKITAGLLYKNGAMLFLFQFHSVSGRPALTFDATFDARLIPPEEIDLPDINNTNERLAIGVHAIDGKGILRALRFVTMPPGLTVKFLSAVQDQLSTMHSGRGEMAEWFRLQPVELIKQTETWTLGE